MGNICEVQKCLCLPLQVGAILFGLFNFLLALITFIFAIIIQNNPEIMIEKDEDGNEDPDEKLANQTTVTTVIIISFVHTLASLFFIIGGISRTAAFLNIWKVYSIVFGIFFFLDNFMDTFEKFINDDSSGGVGVFVQTVISILIWCYMVAVVSSLIKKIKQETAANENREEMHLNSSVLK